MLQLCYTTLISNGGRTKVLCFYTVLIFFLCSVQLDQQYYIHNVQNVLNVMNLQGFTVTLRIIGHA